MTKNEKMKAETIAEQIKESDAWNNELNLALCKLAGLEEEYSSADAETFESVVFKAAELLQVEIL